MIDIRLLKEDPDRVRAELKKRDSGLKFDQLIKFDADRRRLQQELDTLRSEQNAANEAISKAKGSEKQEKIAAMKDVANRVKKLEQEHATADQKFERMALMLPNFSHGSVPMDKDESGNEVTKTVGDQPKLQDPKPHYEIPAIAPLIDFERGAKVSGSRFWFLKGDLVHLEFALIRYALDFYQKKGHLPMRPPTLVRETAMVGTGFFPADKNEIYSIDEGEDETLEILTEQDEPLSAGPLPLFLAGTAEVPLASYHAGENLDPAQLPIRYAGFAPAYRREAGSYGQDTKGILRGHEFDKVELFIFSKPEESWDLHEELQTNAEEFWTSLGIPFQVVNIASGDLGAPNAKKYDIEAWMPGEGKYREVGSNSNDTDFQARRLKIKSGGEFVHTLNNTAVAVGRAIIAIVENYQHEDGSVDMPQVLHQYLPFTKIETENE